MIANIAWMFANWATFYKKASMIANIPWMFAKSHTFIQNHWVTAELFATFFPYIYNTSAWQLIIHVGFISSIKTFNTHIFSFICRPGQTRSLFWHRALSLKRLCRETIVFAWISKSGKFLLKLKVHHSGKFAPRENNPLYGMIKSVCRLLS